MDAIAQTAVEIAHFEVVETYIRNLLSQSSSLSDDEKTLIAGNIRGFYSETFPLSKATAMRELLTDAANAVEEYSCRTPVGHIASEMEALAERLRKAA